MDSLTSPIPAHRPNLHVVREEDPPAYDAVPKHAPGFAVIPAAVFDTRNAHAIAVFAAISKHANKDGECWPSIETIGNLVGLSKPTIIKAVRVLEKAGVIQCERRSIDGMNSATLYRISPEVRRSTTFTAQSTSFTQAVNVVYSGGKRALPEQDSVELEPVELVTPLPPKGGEPRRAKPLPENGPAQKIVKAWCECAGVEQPIDYRKAVGSAQALAKGGITPEDIPDLYGFVSKWASGPDLALLRSQADKWRASKNGRNGHAATPMFDMVKIAELEHRDNLGMFIGDENRKMLDAYRATRP